MNVCSFLPAATSMIYELGFQDLLSGVTFECPSDKPKVVRSYMENNQYSSKDIDEIVSRRKARGESLYYIDMELLENIKPDVIFTQEVCDVCQIGSRYVQKAIAGLKKQPKIITLVPRNLEDVFDNVLTISKVLGKDREGEKYLSKLYSRVNNISNKLKMNKASVKKVMFMEWLNPIYNCGHWIPDQIAIAGGIDELSNRSGYSTVISWNRILHYDPEIIVAAPCGFNVERTTKEISDLTTRKDWNELTAVKNEEVYLADADLFTQPSTTLVDGIDLLAGLFHREIFEIPERLKAKCMKWENELITKLK